MCGIFGLIQCSGLTDRDEHRFQQALRLMIHRGPDAVGVTKINDCAILGHTRLAIIDLDARSNQPFHLIGRYWIVYNGEIFNYLELRRELESQGCTFSTQSDTEVVLHAYVKWGECCVSRFNGMWAFAIYDSHENYLFCSRDRFGEKPFIYSVNNERLIFSSEAKSIIAYDTSLTQPDYNVIANFCRTSVGAQQPDTWFTGVKRLQPGHNLSWRNGDITIRRYWEYPRAESQVKSFNEASEHYRELFFDAVAVRLRSDVPLGLTLSSGVDSTSIACTMVALDNRPHHFFTSGFEKDFMPEMSTSIYRNTGKVNEAKVASQLADLLGQSFHEVTTDYSSFFEKLKLIVYHLESGNSSPAVVPLMQIMGYAKQHVTVVLEGQGADELLGGYILNTMLPASADLVNAGRFREAADSLREFRKTYSLIYSLKMAARDLSNKYHVISSAYQSLSGIARVFGPALRDYSRIADYPDFSHEGVRSNLGRVLQSQHSGGLVNLLHYGDAISMANSVESRNPFMDYRLVEFVWGLASEFKVREGIGKAIHRNAMRGIVPDDILDRREKHGFNTPIAKLFKDTEGQGREICDQLINGIAVRNGLLVSSGIQYLLREHQAGRRDNSLILYRLLCVEAWYQVFMNT